MNNIALATIHALFDSQSIILSPDKPFVWTSGIKSPIYVDCRRIMSFTSIRNQLMNHMTQQITDLYNPHTIDAFAGGESAGIPYAAFIAEKLQKPMIYIRKQPKNHGTKQRIEGVFSQDNPSISTPEPHIPLIEDQASNGQSKFSFVDALRSQGIQCHDCFTIFYYDIFPEAKTYLDQHKLRIHSLARGEDILRYIEKNPTFTPKERDALARFLENPHAYQP